MRRSRWGCCRRCEGQITITAPTAGLTPELEIGDAEIRVAFVPGRIEIQSLTGAALGGRFTARGTIEGAAAGAEISLEARLTGAQLAQRLTRGGERPHRPAARPTSS